MVVVCSVAGASSVISVRSIPGAAVVVKSVPVTGNRSVLRERAVTGAVVGARVAQSAADLKPPCIFPRLLF